MAFPSYANITEDTYYQALINTELFSFASRQLPNAPHVKRLCFVNEFDLQDLLILNLIKHSTGEVKKIWHHKKSLHHSPDRIDFENIFELVKPETQLQLLWHLDLFK